MWGAFLASPLFYGVSVWLTAHSPQRPFVDRGPLLGDPLLLAFVAVSAVAIAVARLVLPRFALSDAALREQMAKDVVMALWGDRNLKPADIDAIKALSELEQRPFKIVRPWTSALVSTWACYESVAILGLVLGYLRHEPPTFMAFACVSILLLLMAPPRTDDLLALALAHRGA